MPTLAYIANANTVSVVDTSTNTVVNNIPVTFPGDYAMIIAITPDGKFAYVTNLLSPVSVIDTCLPSRISSIKFSAKTGPGMTSRVIALLNGLPLAFATISEEQKAFELNLTGGPYPVENVTLINAGNSTVYICNLTTE